MNAVEIEEAVSELSRQPFDAEEFPFAFLRAFGRKDVELKRLKANNASDVPGGVLRRDSIHMAVCEPGGAEAVFSALRESPKTAANRVKFIFATDGTEVLAEETATGDFRTFPLPELDRHFGFFLPLAGISAVRQIKDNPIDVKAVGRLNKLYLELLRENPEWAKEAKRPELNRLMARLVFCFFAEDTGIFTGDNLFTASVRQFSEDRAGLTNTDQVLVQLFLAMATPTQHDGKPDGRYRQAAGVRGYADAFPYVNGGLFEDAGEVPSFSRAARNYLLHAGDLDWREINPDIFGSMIQAVADDDERGSLGMHYTSVPNILKVLNPLFLDELTEKLAEAGDSVRKLKALRRRLSRIRVFDPACGSGNFLVIAYRHMREIENEIVKRIGDDPKSLIPLTNFYGIEIKGFAAEIARLALLIAEFQADSRLISQQAARSMVLPLHRSGQIREGNALQLDWLDICPPAVPMSEEWDLGGPTGRLALEENGVGGEHRGAETYICGNPPYRGSKWLDLPQKNDLKHAWRYHPQLAKTTDYVTGWLACADVYINDSSQTSAAFVMTNSVVQGQQAGDLWRPIFDDDIGINFAHLPFKWRNLASDNAGVTVVIVGLRKQPIGTCRLFDEERVRLSKTIGCLLLPDQTAMIISRGSPLSNLPEMVFGNMPRDGGNLLLDAEELASLSADARRYVRPYVGAQELIDGTLRYCIWIGDQEVSVAANQPFVAERLEAVRHERLKSSAESTRSFASQPHRFVQRAGVAQRHTVAVPSVTSERREFLPCDLLGHGSVISNRNFGLFDAGLWTLALIASRLHWVWIASVCGRLEMRLMYSNTVGWNTFPVPPLTTQDNADLTRCAEDILLAREAHYPATIADLYDPDAMPDDLRRAHERNDETLERIYIGRHFRNDTERLEHLFALYTKMTASDGAAGKKGASKSPRKPRASEKAA